MDRLPATIAVGEEGVVRFPHGRPRYAVGLVAFIVAGVPALREVRASGPEQTETQAAAPAPAATPAQTAAPAPPALIAPHVPLLTPYADRGMLYGPGQAGLSLGVLGSNRPMQGSRASMSLGIGVGLTDRITLDGSLGTLSFAPGLRYSHPQVGIWFGLVDRPALEIDATAHVVFGLGNEKVLHAVEPGALAILRLGDRVRIDTGAYVPVSMEDGGPTGLRVPINLAIQLGRYLHVAVSSGVTLTRVADGRPTIPLGVTIGGSIPLPGGGYVVLAPSLSWPSLVHPRYEGGPGVGPMVAGATISVVTP
jgi:hypothetical protein